MKFKFWVIGIFAYAATAVAAGPIAKGTGMSQPDFIATLPPAYSYFQNNAYTTEDMHLILQLGGGRDEVSFIVLMEFVKLGSDEEQKAHLKLVIESLNAAARCYTSDSKKARRVAMKIYNWRDQVLRKRGPELEESAEGIYSVPLEFNGAVIRGHLLVEEGRIMARYIIGINPEAQ